MDSPLLRTYPTAVELGEDPPREGWALLWETWLCRDGRIIGAHPKPRSVRGGWVVQYEAVEEMSVEALYAAGMPAAGLTV